MLVCLGPVSKAESLLETLYTATETTPIDEVDFATLNLAMSVFADIPDRCARCLADCD